jgi:hypothetical protein
VRKPGGGRKRLEETYPRLPGWIEAIVSPATYGNPENPLVWTTKSLRKIQDAILFEYNVYVAFRSIASQLEKLGYICRAIKKCFK